MSPLLLWSCSVSREAKLVPKQDGTCPEKELSERYKDWMLLIQHSESMLPVIEFWLTSRMWSLFKLPEPPLHAGRVPPIEFFSRFTRISELPRLHT